MKYRVQITHDSEELSRLTLKWGRPEFSPDDGIGPLDGLHTASDAIVLIAGFFNEVLVCIGSGVMIAPGVMLTATHVIKEFPRDGSGPVLLTFLSDKEARVWLPTATVTFSGKSQFNAVKKYRKIVSDLSIVSCSLNSEAHIAHPLSLIPIELCLPLPKTRLWAVGFRQGPIAESIAAVTPIVTSGLVTNCFPYGRGERMPSPCVEVAMEAWGGMSGGPVFNEDGRLVGIISSSFDNGPTYVTLVWDALRVSIDGLPEEFWCSQTSGLIEGIDLGLVRIKGNFKSDEYRNITLKVSDEEAQIFKSQNNGAWINNKHDNIKANQSKELETIN